MKTFAISTFLLAAYITLDLVLNDQMWEANTKLTELLQRNEFQGEQAMMKFFSDWLNIFPAIALLVYMFSCHKLAALLYGAVIMFTISLNAMLKNIYHQPRPFWIEKDIEGLQCNKEFGKPSGHAMQSSVMCFLLPIMLFPTLWQDQQNSKLRRVLQFTIVLIVSLWTIVTGLSRVFLGAHTFGQILLGWVYSTYIMLNYMAYLHKRLLNFSKECLAPKGTGITRKTLLISFIAIIAWINVSFLFYKLNREHVFISKIDSELWLNAITQKCQGQAQKYKFKSASVFQNSCFNSSFQLLFLFFLLLGTKICGGTYDESKFAENFSKVKWYHKLYRAIILIILLMVIEPFVFLIITEHLSRIIMFQTIPILFFGGIVLTFIYPKTLDYLGLNIEGDFLYLGKRVQDMNLKVVPQIVKQDD